MNENLKDAIQILENEYKRYLGILKSLSPSSKEYDKYLVYCYQNCACNTWQTI